MAKFAVIGAGMMGSAIVTGIIKNQVLEPGEIFISGCGTHRCETAVFGKRVQDYQGYAAG